MKFLRLAVEDFGCVRKAEVSFSQGLNILFGPNDLGKSTLARAIRAALLIQHSSSEAEDYVPWGTGGSPTVELDLEQDDNRVWRVRKEFKGSAGASFLSESKDGRSFALISKGRAVDEELRKRLRWGVAPPAGRGGPRGLPKSFLGSVLLGEQADVTAIMRQTIDADTDETGKERLRTALAAFAQDPTFKAVLTAAQARVDEAFTPKGQKKRSKASPFLEAAQEVKRVTQELEGIARRAGQVQLAEADVATRAEEHQAATEARDSAEKQFKELKQARAKQEERQAIVDELEEAERRLSKDLEQVALLKEKQASLKVRLERVAAAKQRHGERLAELEKANATLASAKEALTLARSETAEANRQLQLAELEKRIGELNTTAKKHAADAGELEKGVGLLAKVETITEQASQHDGAALQEARAAEALQQELVSLDKELSDLGHADRLERLRDLEGRMQAATKSRERLAELRAEAEQHSADAARLNATLRTDLPTQETFALVAKLDDHLRIAEARLGGGLRVSIERLSDVRIRADVDGNEQDVHDPSPKLEIKRSGTVEFEGVARLSIVAGEHDAREAALAAREAWNSQGKPILERAGAENVHALSELIDAQAQILRDVEEAQRRARSASDQANELEATATVSPDLEKQLDGLRQALSDADVPELERLLNQLDGETLERASVRLRTRQASLKGKLETARTLAAEAATAAKVARSQITSLNEQLSELNLAPPPSGWAGALALATQKGYAALEEAQELNQRHEELKAQQGSEVDHAEAAVTAAQLAANQARSAVDSAAAEVGEMEREQNRLAGEVETRRHTVEALDLEGGRARVTEAQVRLGAHPDTGALITEGDIRAAEEELERREHQLSATRDALRKAQGVLSSVGGHMVYEQQREAKDALAAAHTRERDVEIEFDAWKLLVEKLREAENQEGQHLGEALSVPVTERFGELTNGRYGKLTMNPDLSTAGVHAGGEDQRLDLLSVGTQEQLATLLRLTIAEQLGSAIVLDDHLTQTDPARGAWFREVLRKHAEKNQVIVITCRPADYLRNDEMPGSGESESIRAAGLLRAVDLERVIERVEGGVG